MKPPEPADLETLAEAVSRLQAAIERLALSLALSGATVGPYKPTAEVPKWHDDLWDGMEQHRTMKPMAYLEY
jgi:hypothetical protein